MRLPLIAMQIDATRGSKYSGGNKIATLKVIFSFFTRIHLGRLVEN
jgi:hypothetical protein